MLFTQLVAVVVACTSAVSAVHHLANVAWLPRQAIDTRAPVPKLLATKTQVEARDRTVVERQATCPPAPLPSGYCSCPSQTLCYGTCVDTSTDPENCGACFNACSTGEVCIGGYCQCAPGTTQCFPGGPCVDLETDPANCGACGNACYGLENTCRGGTCQCETAGDSACPAGSGQPYCCSTTLVGDGSGSLTRRNNGTLTARKGRPVNAATVAELKKTAAAHGIALTPSSTSGFDCETLPTDECVDPSTCYGASLCCQYYFDATTGDFTLECTPLP